MNNLELEWAPAEVVPLSGVVSFDAGNNFCDPWGSDNLSLSGLRLSAGVGLQMRTPMGLLRLEHGIPINPLPDEQKSALNFTIGISFEKGVRYILSMDVQQTAITCPQCRTPAQLAVPLKVDAKADPEAREGILTGTLFAFVCAGCQFTAEVLPTGFLYIDTDRRFMGYLTPGGAEPLGGAPVPTTYTGYQMRVAQSRVQLVEKILIMEDSLDDRHIEILKGLVLPELNRRHEDPIKALVFAGLAGPEREVALSLPDGKLVAVTPQKLAEVVAAHVLPEPPALVWHRFDQDWAEDWLQTHPTPSSGPWWKLW